MGIHHVSDPVLATGNTAVNTTDPDPLLECRTIVIQRGTEAEPLHTQPWSPSVLLGTQ